MNVKCDIIVLTWNQLDIIKQFVESYLENTSELSRLIIIDNGSSDGTPEYLSSLTDTDKVFFKVVLNTENRGFVGGMNQGIELSSASYVCLANNDLIFTKGWLKKIVAVFESNEKIGIINPNSNNLNNFPAKGQSYQEYANELYEEYQNEFWEMPFCIGFCMFIRRKVIDEIGGLSKDFYPMFFEDTDYSLMASRKGFLIGVAKGAYVWHIEHACFKNMGKNRIRYFENSRLAFKKKWGETLRIGWVLKSEDITREILEQASVLSRNGHYIFLLIRGRCDRKELFKKYNLPVHTGIQFKSYDSYAKIIFKVFFKKKKFHSLIASSRWLFFVCKLRGITYNSSFNIDKILMLK